MPTINLRKYYSFLTEDHLVEVSNEVAEAFLLAKRQEDNYHHRAWYHKAYYSLDCSDGIENSVLQTLCGTSCRYGIKHGPLPCMFLPWQDRKRRNKGGLTRKQFLQTEACGHCMEGNDQTA